MATKKVLTSKADLAERNQRYKKTRQAMAKERLDALLVVGNRSKPGYIQYLTNWRAGHNMLLLLPPTGEPVVTISSPFQPRNVVKQGWVTDVLGGFNVYDPTLVKKMINAMKRRGLDRGRIGIAGMEFIPHSTYQQLVRGLPNVQYVEADELMDHIRMVKSPLEIKQVREVHAIVRSVAEHFLEILEPGKTSNELAFEMMKVAQARGASVNMQIGEGDALGSPRDVPLKCNDVLRLYFGVRGGSGHGSEQLLTCYFRELTELESKLMETDLRAYEEVREMAKPGVRLRDMAQTYERVLIEDGWKWDRQKTGYDFHGIGMEGVERPVYAELQNGQGNDWPIEAGTVINYHPRRCLTPPAGMDNGTKGRDVLLQYEWEVLLGLDEDILINPQGAERLLGDFDISWLRMKQ